MFLKKYKTQLLIGLAVLCVIYLVANREHFTMEKLTGNAPKELPLPSELKHSETTPLSEGDKAKLDTRDIPTGFSSESDYLLSPQTVQSLQKKDKSDVVEKTEEEKTKDKISDLEKQIEDLKKQLNK